MHLITFGIFLTLNPNTGLANQTDILWIHSVEALFVDITGKLRFVKLVQKLVLAWNTG
jgi:hypothetical protein